MEEKLSERKEREVKGRNDKRRKEGSEQKKIEGRGQGRTSWERAFGGRACRLAVLVCSHSLRKDNKTNRREVNREITKRSEEKKRQEKGREQQAEIEKTI
jgi:hypothetical protein